MNSNNFVPEILAPAGNLEKLKVACRYGADAVYVGGLQYGLRSGADNFDETQLKEGLRFAQRYGVKVYVTLNAFLHDQDFENLASDIESLRDWGVAALIISDPGVMTVAQRVGGVALHLSTQASCLNRSSAKLWSRLGVSRVITGRELGIMEGQKIKAATGLEVEMFIHGAMCSAYSGNCTISNYTAGRDSNRGGCKQSCRFSYKVNESSDLLPLMSSRDLNGLGLMKTWFDAGIDSLKIEGRMKSCLYVASTCKAYREGVNAVIEQRAMASWAEQALESFSNRGYTQASLATRAGSDSIAKAEDENKTKFNWVGQVIAIQGQKAWVQLKNPVFKGDRLEAITYQGPNLYLTLQEFENIEGAVIERGTQEKVVSLNWEGLEAGMIIKQAS